MYNTIGQGSPLGNIGSFEDFWYSVDGVERLVFQGLLHVSV